mgnify:CR=1 FL=1
MPESQITVQCEADEYGNFILPIPDDLFETLGWSEGDTLEIDAMYNRVSIKRVDESGN